MIQLSCGQVKKYYGAQLVLEDITFEMDERERVAVIGSNGTGKTTVLKIITGEEKPDEGFVSIRKNAAVGYLEQLPAYEEGSKVLDVLNLAFQELSELKARMEELEHSMASQTEDELTDSLRRYAACTERFESMGGYEVQERLSRVCTGLKLDEAFLQRDFATLSGGEKTTVGLARVLLIQPDILLLDEPTNHLDMDSMEWLEAYLRDYKGSVLMVSHDRCFLDAVAGRILELEDGCLEEYAGNYTAYLVEKEKRRDLQQAAYKEQQKKIAAMEKAVHDMREWAKQADNPNMFRRAESMRKRIDRMEKVEKPKAEGRGMRAQFDETQRSGKDVLRIEGLYKAYEGADLDDEAGRKVLFQGLDLQIYYQDHAALLGRNGCGKTTLLKMILELELADAGEIRMGSGVKIGYLPQHVVFKNEELSVIEVFREDMVIAEGKAREVLAGYLFYGDSVFRKVRNLSGGEKSRLLLACLMQKEINLLILDEPTNHLDIRSRENLETALQSFDGTILFVSHDRYFINKMADRIIELEQGVGTIYPGNLDDYRHEKRKLLQNQQIAVNEKRVLKAPPVAAAPNNRQETVPKKHSFAIKMLEQKIEELEAQKGLLLADQPQEHDYRELLKWQDKLERLEQQLDTELGKWLLMQ